MRCRGQGPRHKRARAAAAARLPAPQRGAAGWLPRGGRPLGRRIPPCGRRTGQGGLYVYTRAAATAADSDKTGETQSVFFPRGTTALSFWRRAEHACTIHGPRPRPRAARAHAAPRPRPEVPSRAPPRGFPDSTHSHQCAQRGARISLLSEETHTRKSRETGAGPAAPQPQPHWRAAGGARAKAWPCTCDTTQHAVGRPAPTQPFPLLGAWRAAGPAGRQERRSVTRRPSAPQRPCVCAAADTPSAAPRAPDGARPASSGPPPHPRRARPRA